MFYLLPETADGATVSVVFSHLTLHSENIPDIKRCGQREDEAGKQDARSNELELSVLPIVEVSCAELHKEHYEAPHLVVKARLASEEIYKILKNTKDQNTPES